ncbi:DUF2061 domain-containing protein [Vibrio coralliilyticus]|uniref:DUF2061 domain-containing protein n=1 Tax=Vibrio coralliilyticus TaxID=190893 RepID=UPI00155FBB59|nr:DUF2061 domain-containing protein [Vibrio coralliilyticus]NRF32861.1 DUF2061 domain-containing protein [Vibrio coralliilyticus]NRF55295.1 DUF2061 domain-containing protein [Vibrio coralliilyticus]NRG06141.1 DUF2061 domain-containing protein [Vibrio coralliilyticus]
MKKTLTFAAIHFTIAFTVAYLLTGDILIGSLIAMIEPMVNTVAFYFHERVWQTSPQLKERENATALKTTSFAVVHFSVAFSVAYFLTGSWLVGGIMAAIEPSINTLAYYFHERVWQRKQRPLFSQQAAHV